MSATISLRALDDAILAQLATLTLNLGAQPVPVGDGVIPAGGGWKGQPNAPGSSFTPYLVLTTLTASRSTGPLSNSQSEWIIPYLIQSFGASRAQCRWMGDDARETLDALRSQILTLGAHAYMVQQVRTESIGGVNRVDSTDPPYWGSQDQITIWLSKRSTP